MQKGKCKLCQEDDVDLQRSHLYSAAVYRLLDSTVTSNRNPILVTPEGWVQSSREIADYVLCSPCEGVLSREGEDWVLPRLATREKVFRLHDIVTAVPPEWEGPNAKLYATAENPQMRVKALTHFALGIFWKASVHDWKTGPSRISRIDLGPYGDALRPLLLCSGPLPEHVALSVVVMPPPATTKMLSFIPREGTRSNAAHSFSFYVPGILFMLSVGKRIAQETKDSCFYGNPSHQVLVKDLYLDVEELGKRTYLKAKAAMAQRAQKKK